MEANNCQHYAINPYKRFYYVLNLHILFTIDRNADNHLIFKCKITKLCMNKQKLIVKMLKTIIQIIIRLPITNSFAL